ncbi:GNAT family N-acetyltransferase [Kribbella sp. NBC_01245]|uniref:GNAT family N-acetyltransferase n=1 Tax=Kribbella sp. NBC_01245 TaxID=2903578 RepID=UPI002E2BDCE5|nr:GNAT family N-acetyltransferase [Kribbella sp. NBC_01245]
MRADGVVLREWGEADVAVMVALFDTAEMDRWTPLAHPFDRAAAVAYLARAVEGRKAGTLQFAITEDGGEALGEVLLFPTEADGVCELAYAVGAEYRGRRLAARAIKAVLPVAVAAGYREARLSIATDNVGSQKVAVAAGFARTELPTIRRERKGYVLDLATWAITL